MKNFFSRLYAWIVKLFTHPQEIPPEPQNAPPQGFYVAPSQLTAWLETHQTDPNYSLLKTKIADVPKFIWLNGSQSDIDLVKKTMTDCGESIPCFVIYAIPDRDAQQYSAGGFKTVDAYNAWVGAIGWQIQQSNKKCVFIVEPDALGLLNDKPTTYPCINAAVDILKKNSNTKVFLDAPMWVNASDMAGRVKGAGVERADGISVNVSGYKDTVTCETYAKNVLAKLKNGLQYIVDTSRNGGKTNEGEWCNPSGAKLGRTPELVNSGQVYAYAWVKLPEESDGNCNGGGDAGSLFISRAVELTK
ncbi:MAG: glycoside hydrolase family 6 protein [Pyrinomonadaceae bacterium]